MLDMSLCGVRVLDLTRLAPGPFASQVLAELGAEVIKIEEPKHGDPLRGMAPVNADGVQPLFAMLNRRKMSITLDLKKAQGRSIAQQLAARSDVLLEGFRPGVMERLGLDYERLSEINPGLIYVSISGYGQTGPYLSKAGHDLNYAALGGFSSLTGGAEGPPGTSGVPIADMAAGLWAVLGTLAALCQRVGLGRGQHVDVGMLDGVISLLAMPLAERLVRGRLPVWGETLLTGGRAYYNLYKTSDGRYMALGAVEPSFWQAFCQAVGHPEWIARHGDPDQSELIAEVTALFHERTMAYWKELFAAHDCCCEPVLNVEEVLAHPQVVARGVLCAGYLASPLTRRPLPCDSAPALGEHTSQILASLGYGAEEVQRFRQLGVV
jgi:alpha-methylacyl-CoA racemase